MSLSTVETLRQNDRSEHGNLESPPSQSTTDLVENFRRVAGAIKPVHRRGEEAQRELNSRHNESGE